MLMEVHHRVKLEKKMGFVECTGRGWGIAVYYCDKHHERSLGWKGLFCLTGCSPSIIEGNHSRNTGRNLKQRPLREFGHWLTLSFMLSL